MSRSVPTPTGAPPSPTAAGTLSVAGLTKRFGGVTAVDGVSFDVPAGSAMAVIGPNGAGKSTVLKLIAGVHRPTGGEIRLGGVRLDRLEPHEVPAHGVALAHQVPRPFRGLSVLDNVRLGIRAGRRRGLQDPEAILESCGLTGVAGRPASSLPLLGLKRLEVARALATAPEVLLLDEIAAGLVGRDLEDAIDLVRTVQRSGTTVVLVEHVERVVSSLVDRVLVLDWGKPIAEGTPASIAADETVRQVYLGTGGAHAPASRPEVPAAHPDSPAGPVIALAGVTAGYGAITALRGVDLRISPGEVVAVLGANGAGKSTLCGVLSGAVAPASGSVHVDGEDATTWPVHRRARAGIAHCPEGRRLFPDLTVRENLFLGAPLSARRADVVERLDEVLSIFPALTEKLPVSAGNLSGGQQQMVAIGRSLMSRPRVLVCDEVSLGLAPVAIDALYEALVVVRDRGTAIVLVEQNVTRCLTFADRTYVLERGRVSYDGPCEPLLDPELLDNAYFGAAPTTLDL